MSTTSVAYIKQDLHEHAKELLKSNLLKIVNQSDFYKSPVMEHINGDVTSRAHITLYFGLNPNVVNNQKLIDLINNSSINELELGDYALMNGYQDLYKILIVEVMDNDSKLSNLVNQIQEFDNNEKKYVFKPHITLAYVNYDYELPKQLPELIKTVNADVPRISIFENKKA